MNNEQKALAGSMIVIFVLIETWMYLGFVAQTDPGAKAAYGGLAAFGHIFLTLVVAWIWSLSIDLRKLELEIATRDSDKEKVE